MTSGGLPTVLRATAHVQIVGFPISDFSRHLIYEMATESKLRIVHITSVRRSVEDQARIFYTRAFPD